MDDWKKLSGPALEMATFVTDKKGGKKGLWGFEMFKGRGVSDLAKFTQEYLVKGDWGETRKGSRQEVV